MTHPRPDGDSTAAFDAGGQAGKVWFVTAIVVVQAIGLGFAARALAAESSTWVAGAVLLYGLGCVVGMVVYARCYVRSIVRVADASVAGDPAPDASAATADAGKDAAIVTTLWPGPPIVVREADILDAREHEGRLVGRTLSVNAPWTGLRLRGRRLPLIVDAQGTWTVAARSGVLARLGAPPLLRPR